MPDFENFLDFFFSMLLLVTSSIHEREIKWQKRHPEGKIPFGRPSHNGRVRSMWVGIGWLSVG